MPEKLVVLDLGAREYEPVLSLQKRLAERRRRGKVPDTLILVEHDPVYTLGRNADEANILLSKREMQRRKIKVFRTERGGDVTYHGPGQLVGYPIVYLEPGTKGPVWFVSSIEKVLVETLAGFGLDAGTDSGHRGVWVGEDKIGAIGVSIAGRVTMHGFALNVTTDLSAYGGIVPCGIRDRGVTSMQSLLAHVRMAEVRREVVDKFKQVFDYSSVRTMGSGVDDV
jgi:lipoyl(octanoyl) transferase